MRRLHLRQIAHQTRLVLAAGTALAALATLPSTASATALGAWHFVSAPSLQPPQIKVDISRSGAAPGMTFLAPLKNPFHSGSLVGQPGALIVDAQGNPVWFQPAPAGDYVLNLQAQRYEGRPVLTDWVGQLALPPASTLPAGTAESGKFYVYSNHYKLLRTVTAADGFVPDFHEFTITPRGTALFTADKVESEPVNTAEGAQQVKLVDSEIQEISLKTGKLVFSWDMLHHVPLADSQVAEPPTGGVWDPYHMNSIDESANGKDLLVSARNTFTVYDISRRTGRISWQLGGRQSSYKLGAGASFSWQHDARYSGDHEITMFDDACCNLGVAGAKPQHASRGLILKLDAKTRTATVAHQYEHSPEIAVTSQGDMQDLADGHEFIGWGASQYFSEFTAGGRAVYAAHLPAADESYRELKYTWSATPYYAPSIAAQQSGGKRHVYASWNGATGVKAWEVLAGASSSRLRAVDWVRETGFETAIPVSAKGPYFRVKAIGARGRVLRSSRVVELQEVGSQENATRSTTVTIGSSDHNKKLGRILAASNGHALYLFSKDTKGVSTCTGTCTSFWKPLIAGTHDVVARGSGLNAKLLGTAKLSGGRSQVTYDHHPLYTDTQDRSATTTAGEGASQFGGRWYVVNTKGSEVKPKRNLSNPCNPVCTGY